MKNFAILWIALLAIAACQNNHSTTVALTTVSHLQLLTDARSEWQYEHLRLFPIVMQQPQDECAKLDHIKTLAEGMQTKGFRITELKQFGRSLEPAVNALTVQNKSNDTILMLSGDVVRGGNQDRVIAFDQIIPPGTIKNIDVFCVEHGRWHFDDSQASDNEKAICAFKSYYNVASPQVRSAVQRSQNQQEVWDAVSRVTAANKVSSQTGTYAALDQESEAKAKREAYLKHLGQAFDQTPNVVGMIVMQGDNLLSADVFGHPDLFRRQYASLLHGVVAEAITHNAQALHAEKIAQNTFFELSNLADPTVTAHENMGKFSLDNCWIHIFKK